MRLGTTSRIRIGSFCITCPSGTFYNICLFITIEISMAIQFRHSFKYMCMRWHFLNSQCMVFFAAGRAYCMIIGCS